MMHVIPSTRVISQLDRHELTDARHCRIAKSMAKRNIVTSVLQVMDVDYMSFQASSKSFRFPFFHCVNTPRGIETWPSTVTYAKRRPNVCIELIRAVTHAESRKGLPAPLTLARSLTGGLYTILDDRPHTSTSIMSFDPQRQSGYSHQSHHLFTAVLCVVASGPVRG